MKDSKVFSLNEFRKWMKSQPDKPVKKANNHVELIGKHVESKIGVKRLLNKMTVDEGEAEELAEEFKNNGGFIIDSDKDENVLIEVDCGTFVLPKFFVRKSK